jgi:hypothetical protein
MMTFRTVMSQSCAVFSRNLRIYDLRTGSSKKFADFRQWNDPKNLWVDDLQTLKIKILLAQLCK